MVLHCRSRAIIYRHQILLGPIAIRLDNTEGFCKVHYLKPDQLEELTKNGDVVPSNKPSFQVIAYAFKQHKGIPSEAEVSELAAQVLPHPGRGANVVEAPTKCVREQEGRSKEGSPKEEKGVLNMTCFE